DRQQAVLELDRVEAILAIGLADALEERDRVAPGRLAHEGDADRLAGLRVQRGGQKAVGAGRGPGLRDPRGDRGLDAGDFLEGSELDAALRVGLEDGVHLEREVARAEGERDGGVRARFARLAE